MNEKKTAEGKALRKLLVWEQIAAEIRRRIARGEYGPGQLMPAARDLAREFTTSRTTISRALDAIRNGGVIEMTRGRGTRVLPLGERPALGAVGIFYSDTPPFVQKPGLMIAPAQEVLQQSQQHVERVFGVARIPEMTADEIARRFSGALFIEGLGYESTMQALARRRFPFVVANLEKRHDFACTWVDHRKTTRTAVGLLAALGHRRIALLTRPRSFFFYDQAHAGYLAGLEAAGLQPDPVLIMEVEHVDSPVDSIGAYVRTRDFLPAHPDVTAIVACRDYLAGGACRAISEAGKTVGRDISVIGFDDTSWPRELRILTTFREPMEALGAVAARMLVDRLSGVPELAEKHEIEAPLVVRRSVGPSPDGHAGNAAARFLLRPWEAS